MKPIRGGQSEWRREIGGPPCRAKAPRGSAALVAQFSQEARCPMLPPSPQAETGQVNLSWKWWERFPGELASKLVGLDALKLVPFVRRSQSRLSKFVLASNEPASGVADLPTRQAMSVSLTCPRLTGGESHSAEFRESRAARLIFRRPARPPPPRAQRSCSSRWPTNTSFRTSTCSRPTRAGTI